MHHTPKDESDVAAFNVDARSSVYPIVDDDDDEDDNGDARTNVDPIVDDDDEDDDDDERRRLDNLTARRALAEEAKKGIMASRLEDPDIDAKDSDLRLLQV